MRVALVAALLVLAPAAAAQCSIEWDQPASGRWGTASNWDENRVPDATDSVCIIADGVYTVELRGAHTVQSVVVGDGTAPGGSGPTLQVSNRGGHLTVTGLSEIRQSGRLYLDLFSAAAGGHGVLDGPGDVVIDGEFEWEGAVQGSGTLTLNGETRLGGRGVPAWVLERTVVNNGTMTTTGNTTFRLGEGGTVDNRGVWTWNEAGGAERVLGLRGSGPARTGEILNAGIFRQQGDNQLSVEIPVTNTGTIEVASGKVELRFASTHTGAAFVVAAGGELSVASRSAPAPPIHTVDATTTASVDGSFLVEDAATLVLDADWTVAGTLGLVSFSATPTLAGSGDVTTAGFVWNTGAVLTGSGDFRVTGVNEGAVTGGRGGTLDGRTLRVEGTLELGNNELRNGAQIMIQPGGTVEAPSSLQAGPGGGAVVNAGILRPSSFFDVPVRTTGAVELQGTAGFPSGFTCDGGSVVLDGRLLQVEGSTGTFDGCAVAGPGTVRARNGGTLAVVGGGLTATGDVTVETLTDAVTPNVLMGTGPLAVPDGLVHNRGTLRPGVSPGIFVVIGDLTQTGGRTEVEVAGLVPGAEHDQVAVTGTFTAGGVLDVSLIDAFFPTAGDRFVIATCGTCAGSFTRVDAPPGVTFDVESSPTEIALVVTGAVDAEAPASTLDVLSHPAPNPAWGAAHVEVTVSSAEPVELAVYDALGREVARLHSGPLAVGVAHAFRFDTAVWAPGPYIVRALGPTLAATRALTVVR